MSLENEKLNKFENAVAAELNQQIETIIEDAKNMKKEMLEKANDEFLANAYNEIREQIKSITTNFTKEISQVELETKREVLRHRSKLVDELFGLVVKKLIDFTTSDNYVSFLKASLVKTNEIKAFTDDVIVYVKPDDMKYKEELHKENISFILCEDKMIKIGGLSVYYPSQHVIYDSTFDNDINEEKEKFISNIDLKINL